jgi:2-octaprenyl-6-methoxyphenol hydroxylase
LARPPDLVIAGAGPVGLLLALALRSSALEVRIAGTEQPAAERPIALAHGTLLLLERLGVAIAGTPIRTIHVSQRSAFGRTLIDAADYGLPRLGRVVSYRTLVDALRRSLATALLPPMADWTVEDDRVRVRHEGDVITSARMLVVADGTPGRGSRTREYGQHAVVAHVRTDVRRPGTAFERFTAGGPIALLPEEDGFALVWSTSPDEARALCAATESEFLARLQAAFGTRVGRFVNVQGRASFPLALKTSLGDGTRVLAIGNAAQTLHPVAGQGLNLGMRDAWELAELAAAAPDELGSPRFAQRFTRRRALDRRGGVGFTDMLVRLFSARDRRLDVGRAAGLVALDLLPPARGFLARRMMFGARGLP